ncbi:MAG: protein-L-isoaspartate O-methyltransferase [Spirochaetes bacterium GWF1_51_8]|nr:MAG: protein-L-isoaspartate O-methyltransferase [Spirochaetes bacterium GWF1_51_8]
MVRTQVEGRDIDDPAVLAAMRKVERHLFIPDSRRKEAYADRPLPIGSDQTISQPYIVAYMTELLRLTKSKSVLEIGTGSGYQTAILAELAEKVFTVEYIASLSGEAREILDKLNYRNIAYRVGDGYAGWPEFAPFDAIIVTCAPDDIPDTLIGQLAEGGRMVIPMGAGSYQELMLIEKKPGGKVVIRDLIGVRFVPMVHS